MFKFRKYSNKSSKSLSYAEKKKLNKALKIGAVVLGTTICICGIYQFIVLDYYSKRVREQTISELTNDDSGFVQAYELKGADKLGKGDAIGNTAIFEKVTRSKNDVPENVITDLSTLKNMVPRIDLLKNTVITKDMFVDMQEAITDSIKNQDFNWIRIHAFIQKGDYVDIHYKELDGNDTIVASKKKVTNLSGNIFSTNISEEERMYIFNATVRAAVTGGELYTSIYPDPQNQNAADVTYVLDNKIQAEIDKDPSLINKSTKSLSKNNDSSSKAEKQDKAKNESKPSFAGGNN